MSRGNPSFWQNMGTYAIGLGHLRHLAADRDDIAQLTSGSISWPTPSNNQPEAVDDMWHASINGRGQMVSAKDTDELTEAIEDMFEEINRVTATQSGVAASTVSLNTGTRKYTPNYTTGAWTGNVIASNLDPKSGAVTGVAWQVVGTAVVNGTTQTFSGIPTHVARTIVVATSAGAASSTYGAFRVQNSFRRGQRDRWHDANLINYLRGDQSNETPAGARYRARECLLGDIVNSSPAYIGGGTTTSVINGQTVTLNLSDVVLDLGYDKLPAAGGGASYKTFLATKAARSEGAVFVGANDGMLHGFRNSTGVEVFAFVPRAVLPNMHQLAQRTYAHRYFVDGPNVEADACLGSGSCTWKNLLIGPPGPAPSRCTRCNVTITDGHDHHQRAVGDRHLHSRLQQHAGPCAERRADRLRQERRVGGGVRQRVRKRQRCRRAVRRQPADRRADPLHRRGHVRQQRPGRRSPGAGRQQGDRRRLRGDLKGKMWRFDLSDAAPNNWVALTNPLWTGPTSQPITQAPVLVPHPLGGNVVAFGTGKLYQDTDVSSTTTQAMYGVWDSVPFGTTTVTTTWALTSTSTLVLQTISAAIAGTQGGHRV